MKFLRIFTIFYAIVNFISIARAISLTERFRWSPIDYDFEEAGIEVNRTSFRVGDYMIQGIHPWKEKLFLSVYYFKTENPDKRLISLTYVNLTAADRSPLLVPYPKAEVHRIGSIFSVEVDSCDRLWTLDSEHRKLFIIDLVRDKILREVHVDSVRRWSIYTITVDANQSDCENAYAYIPNQSDFDILVYSFADDKHWTTGKPSVIVGKKYADHFKNSYIGIGISSSFVAANAGERLLYLQPTGSEFLLSVSTSALKHAQNNTDTITFNLFGYRTLNHLSSVTHYDEKNAIAFFELNDQKALGCWNAKRFPNEFSTNTVHFMKAPPNVPLGNVLDLQTDSQDNLLVVTRTLNSSGEASQQDFFLYTANIKEMVKGTKCDLV